MHPSTKARIRRLYTKEGYTKIELVIMYRDIKPILVIRALKGLKKAERI